MTTTRVIKPIRVETKYLVSTVAESVKMKCDDESTLREIIDIKKVISEYNDASGNSVIINDGGMESHGVALIYNKESNMTIMVQTWRVVDHSYGECELWHFNGDHD